MRWSLAIVVCAACTDNTVVVRPIIDTPINDTAQAIALDSLTLEVTHANGDRINSATFTHGETIELPNVSFGDDLVLHMTGESNNLDVAYGRTCVFSVRADARPPSPHLFFARTVKFGHMSQQPLPRLGGIAMTYRDGSGLLIGGAFPDEGGTMQALTQIERFDPNTGAYDVLHEIERRIDAAVAIVSDGPDPRMVIVGGIDPATNLGAEFVEVIDAERNTDRQYEKFFNPMLARTQLTATTLSDGRVIVIGGLLPENPTSNPPTPAIASGLVFQLSTVETGATAVSMLRDAVLLIPRYAHTSTRLTNELGAAVLVAGGLDNLGQPIKRAELFKPLAADGRGAFSSQFSAEMIVPRWQHQAVRLPDGSVLFIGGLTKNPMTGATEVVDQLELFSPLDGRFLPVGMLSQDAPGAGRIGMSATVLPDGRVLQTGGQINIGCTDPSCDPVNTAFITRLDPQDGTVDVLATDRLAIPRSGHQATLLCDGTVLISGGVGFPGTASYERYNPVDDGRR